MRLVAYGGVSTLSATCAVLAAFRQRANFYAAAVYLSKSNACMMVSNSIFFNDKSKAKYIWEEVDQQNHPDCCTMADI
jgi:hypothetical protein